MPSTPAAAAILRPRRRACPSAPACPARGCATQSMSRQVSDAVEIARSPRRRPARRRAALQIGLDIAERLAPAEQHLEAPGRFRGDVEGVARRQPRRHRQTVLDVGVALAAHRQVDGHEQRVQPAARARSITDCAEAAVAEHVELEPERLAGRARARPRSSRSTWWTGRTGCRRPRPRGRPASRRHRGRRPVSPVGAIATRHRDRLAQHRGRKRDFERRSARVGATGWRSSSSRLALSVSSS